MIVGGTLSSWRLKTRHTALISLFFTYVGAALVLYPHLYFGVIGIYRQQLVLIALAMGLILILKSIVRCPRAPLSEVKAALLRDSPKALFSAVGFCLGLAAYTTFKLAIPETVPFYLDRTLAELDIWLHGGVPGVLLHDLLPPSAGRLILVLYGPIWAFLWVGLFAFACVQPDKDLRDRYLWTTAIAFPLIGTLLATGLSSVGPIFYDRFFDDDLFGDLMARIDASAVSRPMEVMSDYLYQAYSGSGLHFGTGISAMPSVHLLVATLNACLLGRLHPIWGAFGWIYVGCILVGSVYLGWHYALDGYVSIAIVAVLWWGIGRVLRAGTPGQ